MSQYQLSLAIRQCEEMPFPINLHLTDIVCAVSVRDFSHIFISLGIVARYMPQLRRKVDDIAFTMINWQGRAFIREVFFDILTVPEIIGTKPFVLEIIAFSFITVERNRRTMKTNRSLLPDDMSTIMSELRGNGPADFNQI